MDHLIFSLNVTLPVFLLMVLGMVFRKLRIIDDVFANRINSFVFSVALPVLLFRDIASVDFSHGLDVRFVFDCFLITLGCIAVAIFASLFLKDAADRGEFIQGSYRGSAAILGVALLQNVYGSSETASMMIVGAVPLYNAAAVTVLALTAPKGEGAARMVPSQVLGRVVHDIATNPLIIGIVVGVAWACLGIPLPSLLDATLEPIAGLATPLGLMSMGAMFDLRRARGKLAPALAASSLKLVGMCALFVPVCVALGYRGEELMTMLVMLGSGTAVGSFIMARALGHEGVLSSTVVMVTTLGGALTLTAWIYVVRSFGLV